MHRRLHLLLAMLIWILWIVSNNNNNSNNYHNDTKSIWSVCHRPLASSHENAIVKSSFVLQLRRRTAGQNLWYNKHSIKTAWQSKWWVYEFNVHKILFFVFFLLELLLVYVYWMENTAWFLYARKSQQYAGRRDYCCTLMSFMLMNICFRRRINQSRSTVCWLCGFFKRHDNDDDDFYRSVENVSIHKHIGHS